MEKITAFNGMKRYVILLQTSIAVVYLWFGALKLFPSLSPAEDLATQTIHLLTFGLFSKKLSLLLLASWEIAAGILLLFRLYYSFTFWFVLLHMVLTFTPLILLPQLSFTNIPYGLTLVGQYILKNIIIASALLVIRFYYRAQKASNPASR
jgi:uncharacterized membrane protein YkgB